MSGTSRYDVLLAAAAGAALGASFVDFRLFLLPWAAVAPLLAIAERSSPRRAFRMGWTAGAVGIALAFAWMVHAFRVFGGFPAPVAVLLYLPLVAWLGVQLGVFTALVAWLGRTPLGVGAPLAFTALEFLFPSLFPWRIANSQYRVPVLLQSGDVAGPALLGFAIVWTNVAVLAGVRALAARVRGRDDARLPVATLAAPAVLMLVLVAYGVWRLADVRALRTHAPVLRVGVVQGNVSIAEKGDRSFFARNLETYREESRRIANDVDLLVWPETVVQHRIATEHTRLEGPDDPFPDATRPLLFGGLAITQTAEGRRRVYNSAFLRATDGRVLGRYDKRMLVPFGEYMPFGDRFPRLYELSPATSNFAAGIGPAILALGPLARLGALICYEDVVPASARDAVASGATLLVNLTNDAWYGDTAEPLQHQALAVWRTVETRRDLVRSTNTGLTSVLAATGEIVAELPTFTVGTLAIETRLLSGTTVYAAAGDLFAWAAVVATAALAVARRRRAPPRVPERRGGRRRARRVKAYR